MKQKYLPGKDSRTVYYLNHNYWWDGLIPLYLNERFFKQKARAIMEDIQMKEYGFFSRIGAFSINLKNPKSAIRSLRYAVESMKRDRSCLFIFPEGKIVPVTGRTSEFMRGLGWLYQQMEDIDFVPIAIHIDQTKNSKPDLYISVGESVNLDNSLDKNKLTEKLKSILDQELVDLSNQLYHVHS